jgi:DNA-binding FadR family transcriptional regulator
MPYSQDSQTDNGTEPIQRRKLSHEVLDRLLARIRSGDFPVGSHLPSERDLMTTFGVGRPAVREALQSLERMGMISITHGERARILAVSAQSVIGQIGDVIQHMLTSSPEMLDQFMEARMFFESGMARIAAQRATKADLERIRATIEAQRSSVGSEAFLDHDMEFHRSIAEVSGNAIYVTLSQAIFEWLKQFHRPLVRDPGAERLPIAEHTRVYDAIAKHDPEAAAKVMTAHLSRATNAYRAHQQHATGNAKSGEKSAENTKSKARK